MALLLRMHLPALAHTTTACNECVHDALVYVWSTWNSFTNTQSGGVSGPIAWCVPYCLSNSEAGCVPTRQDRGNVRDSCVSASLVGVLHCITVSVPMSLQSVSPGAGQAARSVSWVIALAHTARLLFQSVQESML